MSFISNWFSFGQNSAEKFENWTVKVSKQDPDTEESIDILDREQVKTFKDYKSELEKFSKDYIAIIDKDDDGKISYDEFEKHNIEQAKDSLPDITEEQLEEYKETLKTIYSRLNIDNEDSSKDNLDIREVMNYFFTMDSTNLEDGGNGKVNGNITKYEYEASTYLLSNKSNAGENYFECAKYYFEHFFKKQQI